MIPISIIRSLGIDESEFNFQFRSHPNYPSALALSDTLNFLGVENAAYELEKDFWGEITSDFITLYKGKFTLVKKSSNSIVDIYSDKKTVITTQELYDHSTELVILINSAIENKKAKNSKWIILTILCAFLGLSAALSHSWTFLLYNVLSFLGALISYEIFTEKFGNSSPVLSTICGKVDSESNCNKVIRSDKINIFGLKLSEISLVYFVGLFFIGTLMGIAPIMLLISALASSIIIYSLYVQLFVEKKFCKVCLSIIAILILQLLLAYLFVDVIKFRFKEITMSIFLFSLVFAIFSIYNKVVLENNDLKKSNIKNLKFKRNYELFKSQLMNSGCLKFKDDYVSFRLGHPASKIHISLISNPFCGYCKEAHEIIAKLLKEKPNDVSIQIRFNYSIDLQDDNLKSIITYFKTIYNNSGEVAFIQKAGEWFDKRDMQRVKNEIYNYDVDLTEETSIGSENFDLGLTFTPLFLINGYRFPQNYDREDLYYFIDDLLEDEDLISNNLAEAEKLTE